MPTDWIESQMKPVGVQPQSIRRTGLVLFVAGFSTFGLIYYVQSLLPLFSLEFGVSPTQSSLALSATTGVMAFALLISGPASDLVGRRSMMLASVVISAVLALIMAVATNWSSIFAIRLLMGVTLSGVQVVAMAYIVEEIEPHAFGMMLGLFISGGALGGMFSRLGVSVIADFSNWRVACAVMGGLSLAAAVYVWKNLPSSRNFQPKPMNMRALWRDLQSTLRDRTFILLFAMGFLLMGTFVTCYNYIAYRLIEPPFLFSQAAVGMIFLVYLTGIFGSTWIGDMATRKGPPAVLWTMLALLLAGILLTLSDWLPLILAGLALLTFAFFSGHSVASGWISKRTLQNRGLAASLYLFAYYQGSSLLGSLGGQFWQFGKWPGVVLLAATCAIIGLCIALYLRSPSASRD